MVVSSSLESRPIVAQQPHEGWHFDENVRAEQGRLDRRPRRRSSRMRARCAQATESLRRSWPSAALQRDAHAAGMRARIRPESWAGRMGAGSLHLPAAGPLFGGCGSCVAKATPNTRPDAVSWHPTDLSETRRGLPALRQARVRRARWPIDLRTVHHAARGAVCRWVRALCWTLAGGAQCTRWTRMQTGAAIVHG